MNTTQNKEINSQRQKKSEELTNEELRAFKKWVNSFPTKTDCIEALGIKRIITLDLVLLKGSASPDTISKIRQHIAA